MSSFSASENAAPVLGEGHAANLRNEFKALRADVAEIRTHFIAVLAKMDADSGVGDTDYESGETPAALTSSDLTE